MHSNDKGTLAESKVISRLLEIGKKVALPYGQNHRYDLLIDEGKGKFSRVQVKNGRTKNGCVLYNNFSGGGYSKGRKYYNNDVEYFGVYCKELDQVYLIPTKQAKGSLRYLPTHSGQYKKIKFAEKYILHE